MSRRVSEALRGGALKKCAAPYLLLRCVCIGAALCVLYEALLLRLPPLAFLDMDDTPERAISGLTVRIERTLCIGSGNCINVAPEIFVLDEDNIVAFQDETPDIEPDRLEEACVLCPVDALVVHDAEGEQVVP